MGALRKAYKIVVATPEGRNSLRVLDVENIEIKILV
jgi:hypothetical protein